MRKIYKLLFLAALPGLTATLFSCKENKQDPEPEPKVPTVEVTQVAQSTSTSATFKFKLANIESYAYKLTKGTVSTPTDPAVIFEENKDNIVPVTVNDFDSTIYGFEGGSQYTIEFAFKGSDKKFITKSFAITTAAYDKTITIIDASRNRLQFHIEVPKEMNYRYAIIMDALGYMQLKDQYGYGDDAFLAYGSFVGKGPKTITINDGDQLIYGPEEDEFYDMFIKPGTPFVVLVCECDEEGNALFEYVGVGGGGGPLPGRNVRANISQPNLGDYDTESTDEQIKFTGLFAKQMFWTAPPIKGAGGFEITKKITELSARFTVKPSSDILKYGASVYTEEEYNAAIEMVGESGLISTYLREFIEMTGQNELLFEGLSKEVNYKFVVIGQCDELGYTQIYDIIDFKAIESTMPVSIIELKQVATTDNSPYKIAFNIKAPNKDCYALRYLMNYTKDWTSAGMTEEQLMGLYSIKLDAMAVSEINSENGYVIEFDSWEDMESKMLVASYNDDEKLALYSIKGRSGVEPAKPAVTSKLFTSLLGEWTVSATFRYTSGPKDVKFGTNISVEPERAPDAFTSGMKEYDDLYNYFKKRGEDNGNANPDQYAKDQIDKSFAEYKVSHEKFKKKYRDQNRLLMTEFKVSDSKMLNYKSPWKLFSDLTYSSYDIDQLFFDFGPKMFLEVREGDKLTLETNPKLIPPFSNHNSSATLLFGGVSRDMKKTYDGGFPVEVTDENTLTIKSVTVDDVTYLPTVRDLRYGSAVLVAQALSDIVLTKGAPAKSALRIPEASNSVGGPVVSSKQSNNAHKRTFIPTVKFNQRKVTQVELEYVSLKTRLNNSVLAKQISKNRR